MKNLIDAVGDLEKEKLLDIFMELLEKTTDVCLRISPAPGRLLLLHPAH